MTDCGSCLRFHSFGAENPCSGHCVFHNKNVSGLDSACETHVNEGFIDVFVQREGGQYVRVNEPSTRARRETNS